jgi:hypothetical protein
MTWKTIIGLKLQGGVFGCCVLAAVLFNFNHERWAVLPLVAAFVLALLAHAVTKWDDFEDDSVIE